MEHLSYWAIVIVSLSCSLFLFLSAVTVLQQSCKQGNEWMMTDDDVRVKRWSLDTQHLILKQAQATRGGATPSGTLKSPLSTSLVRTPARSSMLHQDAEKKGIKKSYVRMNQFIFVQYMLMLPHRSVFFLIWDGDTPPSHPYANCILTTTDVSLVQNYSH